MLRVPRDALVRNCNIAATISTGNFRRLESVAPVLATCEAFVVQNIPLYGSRRVHDVIVCAEYDVKAADDGSSKRRRVPKYLSLTVVNMRPFTAEHEVLGPPSGSASSTPQLSPLSQGPVSRVPVSLSAVIPRVEPPENSSCIMTVNHQSTQPWFTAGVPSSAQIAVIEPLPHQSGAAPSPLNEPYKWVSPWSCNDGVVAPWIQLETRDALTLLSPTRVSSERAEPLDDESMVVAPSDSCSVYSGLSTDEPIINFYST